VSARANGNSDEVAMPHSNVDEAIAQEAVDTATLVAENASLRDRLLRALADAENTRRRAERTAEEARQYAVADFARELLAIADNLRRTIAAASDDGSETAEALIEGVRATERLLEKVFARFGIRKIEVLDKPFDPNLHEAIMEVEDTTRPPGTVVRVAEDGYMIHDRLLRPARVLVAKRNSSAALSPRTRAEAESDPRASERSS
jgi:molecular chaperone GrpE